MSEKAVLGAPLPKGFCEHDTSACAFCGKTLRYGHVGNGDELIIHERPSCDEFKICDDVSQFAMMTALKMNSDSGCLERN